ncbi:uncharacterized protein BX663DRAFT_270429 [Cokeromyces recurvatus]|uniref:uncharacterized protein n=1 Tax=Cokeromyces recurvatus TaxID=90255 RepID=UPI00221F3FC4|nr:uncharacterized protein BX663DRAFT_270429 [Cokeromyces recurvatus]KAI7898064.1 hypothetical protein BX663DRAFT_270429 [Cokeromyces recurvatus]
MAQAKGGSGAEAIAMEIGAYMGECIQIIEFYGGDVVKFLGDAVLVCFQSINHVDLAEPSERQKNLLVRRGIECGLQLLARLSHYRVYLTAEERSKHRTNNMSSSSIKQQNNDTSSSSKGTGWIPHLFKGRKSFNLRRTSVASENSILIENSNCVDLELHMALTCGNVTNIIVGELDPLESLQSNNHLHQSDFEYHGRLEYAIGGQAVDSLDEALSLAKAGEMTITPTAYDIMQRQSSMLNFEQRRRYYIIKSLSNNTRGEYFKSLSGLRRERVKMPMIEPLIPRRRNATYNNLPLDANRYYFKYINRSALYRLLQIGDNDRLSAQFREVTIMFVSLGKINIDHPEGLEYLQKAVQLVIHSLVKYEGILQQFAIDDKGTTLLSVFGLPPLSHEREAVFAAKAALEIRDKYHQEGFTGFSISLSTGTIFIADIPHNNPYRRDPGISGDTIVVAVRMLKYEFSKESVVCDSTTRKQIGGLCEFEDFGENFMKGKPTPVQVFSIINFGFKNDYKRISTDEKLTTDFIGYKIEMRLATHFVEDWSKAPNHHFLVVTGPAGVGKSFFCSNLYKIIISHGFIS